MHYKILYILMGFIIGGIWGLFISNYAFVRMGTVFSSPTMLNKTQNDTCMGDTQYKNNSTMKQDFTTQVYEKKTSVYEINVTYPIFGLTTIDTDTKNFVDTLVDHYIEQAEKVAPDFDISDYYLEVAFEVHRYGDDIVSVQFLVTGYDGGVELIDYSEVKTYSLTSDTTIGFFDLFDEDSMVLEDMTTLLVDRLAEKLVTHPDTRTEYDAIAKGVETTSPFLSHRWFVDDRGITFVFAPYEVGPGAAGSQSVLFLWQEVEKYRK